MVRYTSYTNGAIRDEQKRLVAFWDQETHMLSIDGVVQQHHADDIEEAMDIVNALYKRD